MKTTPHRFISFAKVTNIFFLAALLVLGGCAANNNNLKIGKHQGLSQEELDKRSAPAKIVVMPLDVELSLLTVSGLLEPKADWSESAIGFMKSSIEKQLSANKNSIQFYQRPELSPEDPLLQLEKLHEMTGFTIMAHEYGPLKLPSRQDRPGEWSLGEQAKLIGQQSDADYALFVFVRDSYSTGGRKALMVLGAVAGALTGVAVVPGGGGQQVGFASLVDLKTGEIAWFNRLFDAAGDLRKADAADKTVSNLLKGLPQS